MKHEVKLYITADTTGAVKEIKTVNGEVVKLDDTSRKASGEKGSGLQKQGNVNRQDNACKIADDGV